MLAVFASTGWILLVWAAGMLAGGQTLDLFRYFVYQKVAWPSAATGTSFPVEEFTLQVAGWMFTAGCVWLALVVAFWVWRATASSADA